VRNPFDIVIAFNCTMSEFNSAFVQLVRAINKHHANYDDVNASVLNGFKNSKTACLHIKAALGNKVEFLTMSTLTSDLVALYLKFYESNNRLSSDDSVCVHLLDDLIRPNFSFNSKTTKFDASQTSRLKEIREKWSAAQSLPQALTLDSIKELLESLKRDMRSDVQQNISQINDRLSKIEKGNLGSDTIPKPKPTLKDIGINDELAGLKIERLFDTKLRYKNHISIFKSHLNQKTTPAALFFIRFPRPFLCDDEEYVKRHNSRIRKWQEQAMREDIEYLEEKIAEIDTEILNYKDDEELFSRGADEVLNEMEKLVGDSLKAGFDKASEKVLRIVAKEYVVKPRKSNQEPDQQEDIDVSNVDDHNNSTSNASHVSAKSNQNISHNRANPNKRPRLNDSRNNGSFNNGPRNNGSNNNGARNNSRGSGGMYYNGWHNNGSHGLRNNGSNNNGSGYNNSGHGYNTRNNHHSNGDNNNNNSLRRNYQGQKQRSTSKSCFASSSNLNKQVSFPNLAPSNNNSSNSQQQQQQNQIPQQQRQRQQQQQTQQQPARSATDHLYD
jgi:hypothetical protein